MAKHSLITGGAGFIGSNYADRLISRGERVTVYDNLARVGGPINLSWLREKHGKNAFRVVIGDVRDAALLTAEARDIDAIIHLAGQVAVTTSALHPREDFESNALGTFNVLEAARLSEKKPVVIYASTNKVYGGMEDVSIVERDTRYEYEDLEYGVPETFPLDFHSPYGCSKGAGDQYVRDYHRIYGLPTVILRQSCIYGPRQFGIEDQGWLAWFIIAATLGKPMTIYGDGKQVRDVLHVEDLMDAYDAAYERIEVTAGEVYNIGGGPENTLSIWIEFGELLARTFGRELRVSWGDWRPGDQLVYISNIRKAEYDIGWKPQIDVQQGVERLYRWVQEHREVFKR